MGWCCPLQDKIGSKEGGAQRHNLPEQRFSASLQPPPLWWSSAHATQSQYTHCHIGAAATDHNSYKSPITISREQINNRKVEAGYFHDADIHGRSSLACAICQQSNNISESSAAGHSRKPIREKFSAPSYHTKYASEPIIASLMRLTYSCCCCLLIRTQRFTGNRNQMSYSHWAILKLL